ncbi:transcription factor bHLH91-like isoform X1 [Salvia hispanica]|uniref:transcription factor bHLH91-like isoform X1 n=2 Tax=Salvia hispanica TaxID=49212 RepID=UPI002008F1F0|nr:transcription factor bHLH91-like isoform X1 [Salvia hispanica]XP_047953016.1 transcription factor bHLH91-like isoform X1 [Salvia hispanica]
MLSSIPSVLTVFFSFSFTEINRKMYNQENGDFDQSSISHGSGMSQVENAFSQNHFSMEEQSYPQNDVAAAVAAASALEMELQQQLEIEQCYNNKSGAEIPQDSSSWQEIAGFNAENGHYHHQSQNPAADFNQMYAAASSMVADAPDLLNIFPLPRSSLLPNFSQKSPAFLASLGLLGDVNVNVSPSADGSSASSGVLYDPLLPLNLPPQPPLLRELFHSLPHGGGVYSLGGGLFTNGVDEREPNVGLYQNGVDRVYEFNAAEIGGKNRDGIKDAKHFATEKHRRVLLNDKYQALRSLVPTPTKNDRASIVGDAIRYIDELKMTVAELKGLVEKKRCARERLKRPKMEEHEGESKCVGDMNGSSLRSSWLHRKSKNTEVDVRIIDDEITVKLVQQKRINCLLFVSKVLDELQLDLHHVAGGLIGDYYSYLFNSKICEGSIVYASAVANKLIEVVDKQYAAVPPPAGSY